MFCKRPCFHDQYLQTFNRDNVTLVDTEGQGVERITESGVVVAGMEYPVDCIVYATGFEVGTGFQRVSGFEIYGRDGLSLSDKWADGIRTLHGMHIHGFPNCFLMSTIQGGFTVNYPHMLDEVATHVAHIVGHALAIERRWWKPALRRKPAGYRRFWTRAFAAGLLVTRPAHRATTTMKASRESTLSRWCPTATAPFRSLTFSPSGAMRVSMPG